jgi:ribonuclease HII
MAKSLPRPSKPKNQSTSKFLCSFRLERESGYSQILGIDEVGRGCLAGPVVAAGVIFSREHWFSDEEWIVHIDDSKKVKPDKREELFDVIHLKATAVDISFSFPEEIDRINILQATFKAAREVIDKIQAKLSQPFDLILMDGSHKISQVSHRQHPVVDGDRISKSIAAASIVAKVARDRWMKEAAPKYPGYGFDQHKGYGTKDHLAALKKFGACDLHRRSFLKKFEAIEHGRKAEEDAVDFLKENGFQIVEKNWKASGGEIDVVAKKNRELHFFEVRFRSKEVELPLIFPASKQTQFQNAVKIYLLHHPHAQKQTYHLHFLNVSPGHCVVPYWDVFKF